MDLHMTEEKELAEGVEFGWIDKRVLAGGQ
jgi:hypothetical protein